MLATLLLLLGGCGESGWIWEVAMRDDYIPPQSSYWVKPGMTEASRINDWVACGGGRDGQVHLSSEYNGKPTKVILEAGDRKDARVFSCMKSRGYYRSHDPVTPSATASPPAES